MATYTELTPKQKSTLEYLSNRMQRILQSDDDEETKKKNILEIQRKVNEVYSAQEEYDKGIRLAWWCIANCQRLEREYGVTWMQQ